MTPSSAADFSVRDLVAVSPMIALFVMSWVPLFIKVFSDNREPGAMSTVFWNFSGLIIATVLTLLQVGSQTTVFWDSLIVDGRSIWSSYLVYLSAAVALMLAYDHVATKSFQFAEFCFLLMSSAAGMLALVMANDLIVIFVAIEIMSLCLYLMVAISREETLSKEAAFKYFVLGSFSSAIFLYGVALIYGTAGGTYLADLRAALPSLVGQSPLFMMGLGLMLLGFAFKVSIFPFHAWTPDVYQGAPTPVTAFMATGVKVATFVSLLRVFEGEGYSQSPALLAVLCWLAALTILIGNVAALWQQNFKRMLAYSSIAHSGYIFVGLIAAGFGNGFGQSSTAVLFYLFSYTVMTLGTFALVALFEHRAEEQMTMDSLKGLANRFPGLALALTVLLLSLAGIPPLLGFFGKFHLFASALDQDLVWLAIWGVVGSVISVYYYLRPIVLMYMVEGEGVDPIEDSQMSQVAVLFAAVLVVLFGIYSSPVLSAVQRSMAALL